MSAAHHVRNVLVRNTEDETDVRTIEIKADSEGRFYAKEGEGFEEIPDDSDTSIEDLVRDFGPFEVV